MSLRVLPEAEADIREAAAGYEEREVALSEDYTKLVREALVQIEANPDRFAALETNRSKRNIRRYLLKRFPYIIIYEVTTSGSTVLAVAHGRRRPGLWKSRG